MILIQARMSSSRLPGKMLKSLGNKTMLESVICRAEANRSGLPVVVATSIESEDDLIEQFCLKQGTACFRGELKNVAQRLLEAARSARADFFVRICGDSPVIDPRIIDRLVSAHDAAQYAVTTNVFPRSYPKGQSVEVVSCVAMEALCKRIEDAADKEHVTRYFYRHSDEFSIQNIAHNVDLSSLQLSVDTADDFFAINQLIRQYGDQRDWEFYARMREQDD